MNFIELEDKMVNLERVSSITILHDKIALDMDCVAEVKGTNAPKLISYYMYCLNPAKNSSKIFDNEYTKENFIQYENILINRNHISAIKFVNDTFRVIFNLSHSTTSYG